MKFEAKGKTGVSMVFIFWALIVLGGLSVGYGFFFLNSPHPETHPKTIHQGVMMLVPNDPYVSEANFTASTSDVFSSFNPFNLTMHVQFNNTQDISKAYLLVIQTSTNTSAFSSTVAIQKFVSSVLSAGSGFNFTGVLKEYPSAVTNSSPIRATAIFSVSGDGQFTVLILTLQTNGVFTLGKTQQTLLDILPYSSYLQSESVREVAQSTVIQIWLSYLMLGFTLIVTSFTLSQVVEVKSKPRGRTVLALLAALLVALAIVRFFLFS
jgi:hypothetical protein